MQSKNCFDVVAVKDMCSAYSKRTVDGFFCRLEQQQGVTRHLDVISLVIVQNTGKPQETCHMAIGAAGMHTAFVGGRIGEAGLLLNWQGVHVCAKSDGFFSAKIEICDQACFYDLLYFTGEPC